MSANADKCRARIAYALHAQCVRLGGENFSLSRVAAQMGVNKGMLSDALKGRRAVSARMLKRMGIYRPHERHGGSVRVRMSPSQARALLGGELDADLARRVRIGLNKYEPKCEPE